MPALRWAGLLTNVLGLFFVDGDRFLPACKISSGLWWSFFPNAQRLCLPVPGGVASGLGVHATGRGVYFPWAGGIHCFPL